MQQDRSRRHARTRTASSSSPTGSSRGSSRSPPSPPVLLAFFRVPYRRDLMLLGMLLPLGVIGQAVLGGLTVIYDLRPGFVMGHFGLSMLILIAAWQLHWRSRPQWEAERAAAREMPPDRVTFWAGRLLAPIGALTVFAGTAATAAGPACRRQRHRRRDRAPRPKGSGTLDWAIHQHGYVASVLGAQRARGAGDRAAAPCRARARDRRWRRARPCSSSRARSARSSTRSSCPPRSSGSTSAWRRARGSRCCGRGAPPASPRRSRPQRTPARRSAPRPAEVLPAQAAAAGTDLRHEPVEDRDRERAGRGERGEDCQPRSEQPSAAPNTPKARLTAADRARVDDRPVPIRSLPIEQPRSPVGQPLRGHYPATTGRIRAGCYDLRPFVVR